MRHFLKMIILTTALLSCSKDSQEDTLYGYEVNCDHCRISYVDARGKRVTVDDQRSSWNIEFHNVSNTNFQITANSLSANSNVIHVYILENRSRVATQSGSGSVSTSYKSGSSSSGSGGSSDYRPSSGLCGAPTQKGGKCQRTVVGGGRCWQH